MLEGMSVLPVMMDLAMESGLDQPAFARLWRNRRNHAPYLRALLRHLELQGRRGLAARVCHFGLNTVDRPLFARKLAELNAKRPQPAAAAPSVQPYAPAAGQPPVQAAE
jgi:hypothetical protein